MPLLPHPPHSYRDDADVPAFDDARPLFVFDGVCVLCSGGAAWLMRRRAGDRFAFAASQSNLGAALHRHYGVDLDDSYLLISDGRAYTESRGYGEVFRLMGGAWRILGVMRILPEGLRDALYRWVARNRYRWTGKAGHCALLTPSQRARLLDA